LRNPKIAMPRGSIAYRPLTAIQDMRMFARLSLSSYFALARIGMTLRQHTRLDLRQQHERD